MNQKKRLIEYLSAFVTNSRFNLFNKVIADRTNYISVALEDIYQPQNASAVLRSCDCFGVQNVNIIENRNKYKVNPDVALGSDKWLNMRKFNESDNNTISAINTLKKEGYRIVATTPHKNDFNPDNFDIEKGKFVLFLGSELKGLSNEMLDNADEFIKIPMYGFTESFNISVSAAILIHTLTGKLRNSNLNWKLSENEKIDILLDWLRKSVKKVDLLENKFWEDNKTYGDF